jgi:hypothetical protein
LSPAKVGGQLPSTIRCHTSNVLLCVAGFVQADSDGRGGGYVDIIDMGVKLGVIERKFDGSQDDVCVWVGRIEEAGLNEGRSSVVEEDELPSSCERSKCGRQRYAGC